jgi:hypothetical protein
MSPKVLFGDLNRDGLINASDWTAFKASQNSNFAGLSSLESYSFGDLDGDFDRDLSDFLLFRDAYDLANGAGALSSLIGVPEPSSIVLASCLLIYFGGIGHRFKRVYQIC